MTWLAASRSKVVIGVFAVSCVLAPLSETGKSLDAQTRPAVPPAHVRAASGPKLPGAEKKPGEVGDPEVIDGARYLELVKERRGKPVMVSLWATWCEPCRDEYPMVVALSRQYEKKGLSVFGVSLDEDAEAGLVRRFLSRAEPGFPNYRKKPGNEEGFINLINPKWSGALPATFFYSRDGRLLTQIVGESKRENFEAAIQQIIPIP
jgi:thiol-disulfide isomerase/thioredoxin